MNTLVGRRLNHMVPLTPDLERAAHLTLPADLTPDEAERIAAFVKACALEKQDA